MTSAKEFVKARNATHSEGNHRRRDECRAKGVCTICGKRKPRKGCANCGRCLDRIRDSADARKEYLQQGNPVDMSETGRRLRLTSKQAQLQNRPAARQRRKVLASLTQVLEKLDSGSSPQALRRWLVIKIKEVSA